MRNQKLIESEEATLADRNHVVLEDSQRAHELQAMLLPKRGLCSAAWETYYDYSPAWVIGGDYCDLLGFKDDIFFFTTVRGKTRHLVLS